MGLDNHEVDIASISDVSVRHLTRAPHNKWFKSSIVSKEFRPTKLDSLVARKTRFFYVDDPKFRISDLLSGIRDRNVTSCFIFFPEKGSKFDPDFVSKQYLYGATVAKVTDGFERTVVQKTRSVGTKYYRLAKIEKNKYSSYSDKYKIGLEVTYKIPDTATHYFICEGGKVAMPNVTIKGISVAFAGPANVLYKSGMHTKSIGVTKSAEKIVRALGLLPVWEHIAQDVKQAMADATGKDHDKLTAFSAKKNSYSSSMMNKPVCLSADRVSEITDPLLRNLWGMEWEAFEQKDLHWIFSSGFVALHYLENTAGVSIANRLETLRSDLGKYDVLDPSYMRDADKTIKLVNFVNLNF